MGPAGALGLSEALALSRWPLLLGHGLAGAGAWRRTRGRCSEARIARGSGAQREGGPWRAGAGTAGPGLPSSAPQRARAQRQRLAHKRAGAAALPQRLALGAPDGGTRLGGGAELVPQPPPGARPMGRLRQAAARAQAGREPSRESCTRAPRE